MNQWDYLRAFHAAYPHLGALEPLYLRYFNAALRARKSVKPRGYYKSETFYAEARRAAASEAERNVLADYRAGRVRATA